ncbi:MULTISPECIES: hypothetical protein [Gammaproteobacteria]|uniref:Uncharacterized protein n=1 Tax=Xanthomonas boreopolis TaxID=86183 RepID=A0A919F807_9XANT|nr:hypothetical protein [Pseudomonas sp. Hp2]GHH54046.1 hypothetical protein GCM10009090_20260 [[Pseudomonas] boreopolis]
MQTVSAFSCPIIDVQAELSYWQAVHAGGHLGRYDFSDYATLLKLGYDVYLAHPHASELQLYRILRKTYRSRHPMSPVPWEQARGLVRHAWRHMEQSARER